MTSGSRTGPYKREGRLEQTLRAAPLTFGGTSKDGERAGRRDRCDQSRGTSGSPARSAGGRGQAERVGAEQVVRHGEPEGNGPDLGDAAHRDGAEASVAGQGVDTLRGGSALLVEG